MILCRMLDLCGRVVALVIDLFRPRAAVEAELLVLRQQIVVLRRGRPARLPLLRFFGLGHKVADLAFTFLSYVIDLQ
jgi:hypothetical protein